MHRAVSELLALVFVLLGGLNVWLMLAGKSGRSAIRLHRTAGYLFIAIYAVMFYYMALRLRGITDEVPPRVVVHIALALFLLPLLIAKVVVARYQRSLTGVLRALGIAIFAVSFTLVALNVLPLVARMMGRNVSPLASPAVILCILGLAGLLLLRRPGSTPGGAGENYSSVRATDPKVEVNRGSILLTLVHVRPQTRDSKTLRFMVPPEQRFSARPGQFLNFHWVIDGKQVVRSYSICSSPLQASYVEITAKRAPQGHVSVFLNDRALPGLLVKADGPYGQFCFDERQHKRIVLIAGGSGITPMMSMLRYIDDLRLSTEVTLIYCVRTEHDVIFEAELLVLKRRLNNFRYVQVLSQPGSGWKGPRGYLSREVIEAEVPNLATSTFFLCGPPRMMESYRELLTSIGVDPINIKQESFGGTPQPANTRREASGAFKVDFARSGKSFDVSPPQTVLEASEAIGVNIPFGCRQGECGTCTTRLLAGEVHMDRQDGLTPELKARGHILPCVSHPRSDITVDA
jgi:ferredoxin-NADP reductase